MRQYSFALTQLKPLHQGIQNNHSSAELFVKYSSEDHPIALYNNLMDWARKHKTIIYMNPGFAAGLVALRAALKDCPYPWAMFHEDEETMYSVMTSISIILPAKIYEAADHIRNGGIVSPSASGKMFFKEHVLTPWDLSYITLHNTFRMAD